MEGLGCLAGLGKTLICNRIVIVTISCLAQFQFFLRFEYYGVSNEEIFQGINLQLVAAGKVLIRT